MKIALAALLLTAPVLVIATPRPAQACSCISGSSPLASFERADAVFVGKVANIGKPAAVDNEGMFDMLEVLLEVERDLKGVPEKLVTVYTASSGVACGFHFAPGERYLIYAYKRDADLYVGLCSRSSRLKDAREDLDAFDEGLYEQLMGMPANHTSGEQPKTPANPPAPQPSATGSGQPATNATPAQTLPPGAGGCAGCAASGDSTPVGAALSLLLLALYTRPRRSIRR